MRNPRFNDKLKEMSEIHDRKNADYADDANPYSNFEFAAQFAGCSVDTVFNVLIGIKQARLNELIGKGKVARNESIDDTLTDRAVYATLQASYPRAGEDTHPQRPEADSTITSGTQGPSLGEILSRGAGASYGLLPTMQEDPRRGPDLAALANPRPRNTR